MNFEKYLSSRRSIYKLGKNTKLSVEEIENLVSIATKYVPSPFNDQSQRVVLLLNDNHEKFWDIVYQELKKIAPPENLAKTEEKLKNFANGIGTILFFDDKTVTDGYGKQFPLYEENFRVWSEHANAMLQYILWLELSKEELGASLQHYNPVIDQAIKKAFNLPSEWKLIAQMPFGEILEAANPNKTFIEQKEKFLVLI
jgi:predicted oxidoreductase (fatty acid repression mutant protein)